MRNLHQKIERLKLGLYTMTEAAVLCGLSPYYFRRYMGAGLIPPPTTPMPGNDGPATRRYYTEEEVRQVRRSLAEIVANNAEEMEAAYLTQREAARRLGCRYDRFYLLVDDGRLPAPTHRPKGKRRKCYKPDEMDALREAYKDMRPSHVHSWTRLKNEGYFSGRDAARMLSMPDITFNLYLKKGIFARPTHHAKGTLKFCYIQDDVENMKKILQDRGYVYRPMK